MDNSAFFCKGFAFNIFRFKKYRHNDASRGVPRNYLALMLRGKGKIISENKMLTINEGDLFFIPNGCKYRSDWIGEPDIEFISLGFLFLPNFENRYYPPQVISNNANAVKLMYEIVHSPLDAKNVGRLYTLAGMLLPSMAYNAQSKQTELIDQVKRLIVSNPDSSVSDIARECAVSESALYAAFKKHSDQSIHDIKKSVKMEKAKELLISTDESIEEISRRLHFSSGSYFRKCCKEHFGASPRELRKREGF